ncbi:response regulator [Rhizohabitans arisaemae]|uniref:response regulator n=1 Tax=Rhizohabitans arisaemae TaxID=2720610 RepID=UPI0024B04E9F|nr:response regulator transcription factor [Rhizohabitans arisaemae]
MAIKVLICDPVPVVRDGLVSLLAGEADIEVVATTGDGWEALSLARRHSPEIIITDVELSGISGLDLAARVTGSVSPPPPEILVFSAQLDDASIMRALEVGAYGYLAKHSAPHEMKRAIRALASGEAATSGEVTRRLIDWLFWRKAQPIAPARQALASLTPREADVMRMVARGMSNQEIAKQMSVQVTTVRSHIYHLRQKLALRDRAQLVSFAYQSGFSVPTVPMSRDQPGRG